MATAVLKISVSSTIPVDHTTPARPTLMRLQVRSLEELLVDALHAPVQQRRRREARHRLGEHVIEPHDLRRRQRRLRVVRREHQHLHHVRQLHEALRTEGRRLSLTPRNHTHVLRLQQRLQRREQVVDVREEQREQRLSVLVGDAEVLRLHLHEQVVVDQRHVVYASRLAPSPTLVEHRADHATRHLQHLVALVVQQATLLRQLLGQTLHRRQRLQHGGLECRGVAEIADELAVTAIVSTREGGGGEERGGVDEEEVDERHHIVGRLVTSQSLYETIHEMIHVKRTRLDV